MCGSALRRGTFRSADDGGMLCSGGGQGGEDFGGVLVVGGGGRADAGTTAVDLEVAVGHQGAGDGLDRGEDGAGGELPGVQDLGRLQQGGGGYAVLLALGDDPLAGAGGEETA